MITFNNDLTEEQKLVAVVDLLEEEINKANIVDSDYVAFVIQKDVAKFILNQLNASNQ